MDRGKSDGRIDLVREALTEPLRAAGVDLEAVEITPAGPRSLLVVAVDKDGGVTLDDVAEVTKLVSGCLDSSEAMGPSPYTLEVTSRGVDRPLVLPRHWRRNVGRPVSITRYDGDSVTGRVQAWDDEPDGGVTLNVDGDTHTIAYGEIRRAMVQIEFNKAQED